MERSGHRYESPLASDAIEKLNEIIVIDEELDEFVLKAANMALIRPT